MRGVAGLPQIKTFLAKLYETDGFEPTCHVLWDLREAGFPEVTPVEIKDLAYFVRVHWADKYARKTAIVVSGDYHFGLSRMFEQFIGPSAQGRIRTFRELPPALDWLEGKATASPLSATG